MYPETLATRMNKFHSDSIEMWCNYLNITYITKRDSLLSLAKKLLDGSNKSTELLDEILDDC